MELELHINGVVRDQDVAPNESLLSLLHREGFSSVKHGCDSGECGACTVLVDGVPRPSCVTLAAQVAGCTISTVESLGTPDALHPLQAAFAEIGATGCGFCTSGMLLAAYALLKEHPSPTEEEIRDALSGNICRCTGYEKPVQAVLRAAAILRGEKVEPLKQQVIAASSLTSASATTDVAEVAVLSKDNGTATAEKAGNVTTKIPAITPAMLAQVKTPTLSAASVALSSSTQAVGKSLIPRNALTIVTGKSKFTGDDDLRHAVYGRILTSPHAHAVIRNIDVSRAKALSGVLAVLTYKDVPHLPYTRVEWRGNTAPIQDQYCLDYVLRYVGDRVAAVAAETPEIAEEALGLIDVEYDVQPPILDPRQALEPKATRVHPELESKGILDASRNIATRVRSEIGDVERGFAEADLVVESEYIASPTQQAPVELHTVTAYLDEKNVLVIRTNSQVPQHIRRTLAQILGLPLRLIRVEQPPLGGSFGARQEVGLEDICALLALSARRPVRMEYSRADEFRSGSVRRQHVLRLKSGLKRDGTLLANQMIVLADTGAYGTHALASPNHGASALALYPCSNMRFVAEVLYTNHAPAGAYQGYELTHEFFALEAHMDDIAEQLGIDALELRRRNWLQAGDRYSLSGALGSLKESTTLIESCNLAACAQVVAEHLKWSELRGRKSSDRYRRGIGLALTYHADFALSAATSGATIKLNEDGSCDIFISRGENGANIHTLLAQIAAETLGVEVDAILLHAENTDSAPFEINVNDSSALYAVGGAVKKAAEQVQRQILAVAGRMLNVLPESLKIQRGVVKGSRGQQLTVAQVAAHSLYEESRQIMTSASWKSAAPIPFTFAAQGAEVEVDVETGAIRVLKLVSAVDIGRALNPLVLESQIEGTMTQALGMSLSEELFYDQHGHPLTIDLHDYHLFSANEMPELQTFLVESQEGSALFGAKSATSVALYGIAPAIANAVRDAVHIGVHQLPLTPERILRALHAYMARQTQTQTAEAQRS
jgi:Aerobic-type carbon monoxide dehydrogenase, large subunit CoxL/CutL homologs